MNTKTSDKLFDDLVAYSKTKGFKKKLDFLVVSKNVSSVGAENFIDQIFTAGYKAGRKSKKK